MEAEVKSLYSLEVEDNLIFYWPDDLTSFGTWIRAYIGPKGEGSRGAFDFLICTKNWLKPHDVAQSPALGRHILLFDHYDYDAVELAIESCVARSAGGDWATIAAELSRTGVWEFDDQSGAWQFDERLNGTAH
jgi:hypothetical protein